MDGPIEASAHLPQDRQKLAPILVLEENVLPLATPGRDMVKSAGVFQSQWSCHASSLDGNVGMLELTLNCLPEAENLHGANISCNTASTLLRVGSLTTPALWISRDLSIALI
jgi:hypothetical protein